MQFLIYGLKVDQDYEIFYVRLQNHILSHNIATTLNKEVKEKCKQFERGTQFYNEYFMHIP